MSQVDDFLNGGSQPSEIDSFLGPDEPKPASAARKLGDLGLSVAKGVVAVPEAVVGLADLVSGGRAGKFAEESGVRFKDAKDVLSGYQSDDYKGKQKQFNEADGFIEKTGVALQNPSLISNAIAESVPLIGAGGVGARALMAAAPKVGAVAAGAAGEGIVGAGSSAEGIRQETQDGLLTGEQAGLAGVSGGATALFGAVGGKVAKRLGIADADTALAAGTLQAGARGADKGILRRAAEGALSEGVLEELPQSLSEQALQNVALGKDWTQDLDAAAAMGLLSGGAMGAGMGALSRNTPPPPAPVPPGPNLALDPSTQLSTVQSEEMGAPNVAQATPPDGRAVLNAQQAQQQLEREAQLAAQRAEASPDDEILASTGALDPIKPSQAMGIKADAGPLSRVAAGAVDGGMYDEIQQAQATEQDQAAYDAYMAQQEADAQQQDTANQSITQGPLAEAQMSEEDKRAVLFSNQAVADGGRKFEGTQDGDILNGMSAPFATRFAAARRAKLEGAGWTIAPVFDGFVARRKDADVSTATGTEPGSAEPAGPVGDNAAGSVESGRPDRQPERDNPRGAVADSLGQSGEQASVGNAAPVVRNNRNLRPEDVASPSSGWVDGSQKEAALLGLIRGLEQGKTYQELGIDFGADDHELTILQHGKAIDWLGGAFSDKAMRTARMDPGALIKNLRKRVIVAKRVSKSLANSQKSIEAGKGVLRVENPTSAANEPTGAQATPDAQAQAVGADSNAAEPATGAGSAKVEANGVKAGDWVKPTVGNDTRPRQVDSVGSDGWVYTKSGDSFKPGQFEPTAQPVSTPITGGTGVAGNWEPPASQAPTKPAPGPASLGSVKADMDHLFGVDARRTKALERIAEGKAWFGNALKAGEFIAKNGLKGTHESVKTGDKHWDVRAKSEVQPVSQPQEQTNGTQADQAQSQQTQPEAGTDTGIQEPAANAGVGGKAEGVDKPSLKKAQAKRAADKQEEAPTVESVAKAIQQKVASNRRKYREKSRKEREAKGYAPNSTPESEQTDYDAEIGGAPGDQQQKSAAALLGNDPVPLIDMFVNGNFEASEDVFKEITGVRIRGLSAKDKKAALYKWANWTPEQIAQAEQSATDKEAERAAKIKQDDLKSAVMGAWLALDRLQVGETKISGTETGQEFVIRTIESGFDKVHWQKKGVAPIYGFTNGKSFTTLKNGALTKFVKAAIAFGGLDKTMEYVNPPKPQAPDGFVDRSVDTAAKREPTEHAGLKIYPVNVKVGDKVEQKWGVQTLNNSEREKKGERQLGGDPLADTLEGAKKLAEQEVEGGKRIEAYRAEMAALDDKKKEADAVAQAKKDANKGKSIAERRKDSILDGPTKLHPNAGLGTGTKREAMQKAVEQDRYIQSAMVRDEAAKKRDQESTERARRNNLPTGNINYPGVKEYFEAVARLKADDYTKPEYRVYDGRDTKGAFREISKTEYDYAQELKAKPTRETITPADDKNIGVNVDGNQLYERKDGSVYQMDGGKPRFSGFLEPVSASKEAVALADTSQSATETIASKDATPETFEDGALLTVEDLMPYYEQEISGKEAGVIVPNPRFEIGTISEATANEIAIYIDGYKGVQRKLRVSGRTLKHIEESRPSIAREIVSQLPGMFTNPDEVLPDHKRPHKRALLVKNGDQKAGESKPKSHVATVEVEIEVEISDGYIDIVTIMTAPDRSLRAARELKNNWPEGQQRTEQAVNSPHPLTAKAADPEADSPDTRPVAQSLPPATPEVKTFTPEDVAAAEKQAIGVLQAAIDKMKADAAQRFAARFLPTMGVKVPVGKARINAAMNDPKINLLGAADALNVSFAKSIVDALEAKQQGRVADVAEQKDATPENDRDHFTLERLNRTTDKMESFTFARGEYIRYQIVGKDNFGEIDGISHTKREFSVDGLWYPFGFAAKAERPAEAKKDTVPLSSVVDSVNKKYSKGLTDADKVPESYTLSEHQDAMVRLSKGDMGVDEYKAAFERALQSRDKLASEFAKMTKEAIMRAARLSSHWKNETKERIVKFAVEKTVEDFHLGESLTYSFGAGMKDKAIANYVESATPEMLREYAGKYQKSIDDAAEGVTKMAQAIKDPQTLEDYLTVMRAYRASGKSFKESRMMLTPEQRAKYDDLTAADSRSKRKSTTDAQRSSVAVAGQLVDGNIIATKHTKKNTDLFVVQLAERVSKEDYDTLNAGAKRIGGYYSSYRGAGAVPGFTFTDRAQAEAFVKLAQGDNTDAQAAAQANRDSFEDDRSQTATQRLTEMADRLEGMADASLNQERKANTSKRAQQAASAEAAANADKAMAKTMRNLADAISNGTAKFLDRVRQKVQVAMLQGYVATAKGDELRAKYASYSEQERHKGEPPTMETADYAEFPTYTASRSNLASLARQLLDVDGTKLLGQRLLKEADDVTDAYLAFAKENLLQVSAFRANGGGLAAFGSKAAAEASIARSGYKGKAIAYQVKRGQHTVVLSPSEAIERGIWQGDGDTRITLHPDTGAELVEKIGKAARRGAKVAVPWQLETAHDRRKALTRMGIETPAEFRAALREFIGLQEQAQAPSKVKELERAMIGRRNDGMDFFPTPESVADEMVATAGIEPGMAVLEPSAGWGHIAERIRAAGVDPDVGEMSDSRRKLLEAKGFRVVGRDFMELNPRDFFTYGDTFRAKDGTEGVMRGLGGLGSNRVRLVANGDESTATYHDRDDLTGIANNGSESGYDRILMNPPFSDGRDIQHVQHAYTLLKPGGRIVAIMGESAFTNQNKRATEFREWLESVGGTEEKLAEGTFTDPSLPVNTGANARMVVIEKLNEADPAAFSRPTFSRGAPAAFSRPTFSRGAQSQANESVERLATGIASHWKNAPKVVVAFDMNDPLIPESVRKEDQRQRSGGATGTPEGFYYKGTVYLMSSKLGTPNDIARVLFHEALGHYGLRGTFGKALRPILRDVAMLRRAEVDAKIKQYGLKMGNTLDRFTAAEEVLAELAQTKPEIGFVQRAIAAIRTWLRQNVPGFNNMRLSDNELIQNYILPARAWVEQGGGPKGGLPVRVEPTFSRGTNESMTNKDVVGNQGGRFTEEQAAEEIANDDDLFNTIAEFTADDPDIFESKPEMARRLRSILAKVTPYEPWFKTYYRGEPSNSPATDRKRGFRSWSGNERTAKEFADEYRDGVVRQRSGKSRAVAISTIFTARMRVRDGESHYPGDQAESFILDGDESTAPDSGGAMFSRSLGDTLTSATNSVRDVAASTGMGRIANKATAVLNERLSHEGTIGLWHKTFGSMYNLAKSHPLFQSVFDSAQNFINDVSYYASEAADRAPTLLPRLEDWRDLTKTPISAEDNKAIQTPIFEGTLSWGRNESGKPVKVDDLIESAKDLTSTQKAQRLLRGGHISEGVLKMWQGLPMEQYEANIESKYESDMLRAGVLWTDAELKSMFGLTGEKKADGTYTGQLGLYHEFRNAIDNSLDSTAKAEMLRFAGKDAAPIREMVLDAPDADTAAVLLRDHLLSMAGEDPARSAILADTANGVMDRADKVKQLKDEGYAPLSRFGQYTVDVVVDGEREYFGLFETKHAANQMAAKMRIAYGDENVSTGTMSDKEFQLFQGITPESMELFGNMLGLDATGDKSSDAVFQEYLKRTKNNRSAMKRLIRRKGIAGFSTDTGRVLASFIYSNARMTSAGLHMGELDKAVQDIPKGSGQLKDAAIELREYIKNPREEAQAMRGLLFAQYLGGNVASMLMNFMQVPTVSLPYLSQFGGVAKATGALVKAMKDQKSNMLEKGLQQALKAADEKGITQPQSVHELMAQSRGSATLKSGDGTRTGNALAHASNNLSKFSVGWGKLFGMAEQINRRSTFIAAYRLGVEQGVPDPAAFAEKAVNETQFINNKANKAKFARGAIGGTLMTFKSYSTNYLELLYRLSTQNGPEGKKAALLMLGMLFLMAGAGGMPGAEDAEDLIDGIGQRMGYNLSTKKAKEKFLEETFGKPMAQFIMSGISGLPGSPIDISGRAGLGNLIPGTGVFMPKASHANDLLEFGGPAAGMLKRFGEAVGHLSTGNVFEAAMAASPVAIANMRKGVDMLDSGMYKDAKGYKVMDTTTGEALAKIAGFQPKAVKDDSEDSYLRLRTKNFYNEYKQSVAARWANGMFESDPDQVQEAKDMIASWNEKNPELPMRPNMMAVAQRLKKMRETRKERILKGAPKAMQATIRKEIAEDRAAQ